MIKEIDHDLSYKSELLDKLTKFLKNIPASFKVSFQDDILLIIHDTKTYRYKIDSTLKPQTFIAMFIKDEIKENHCLLDIEENSKEKVRLTLDLIETFNLPKSYLDKVVELDTTIVWKVIKVFKRKIILEKVSIKVYYKDKEASLSSSKLKQKIIVIEQAHTKIKSLLGSKDVEEYKKISNDILFNNLGTKLLRVSD